MKELIIKDTIDEYLSVSKYINWNENIIISKADEFKQKYADEISLIKAIYEFVRDEIKHSWDAQDKRVTKSATEVLEQGVGNRRTAKGKPGMPGFCLFNGFFLCFALKFINRHLYGHHPN